MHKWSHYQQAIFEAFEHTSDSLLIEAVAGSGKTTVLVELARIMRERFPQQRGCFMAFNKSIATTLQERIGVGGNVVAMTLHSAGWAAWRRAGGLDWTPTLDQHKVSGIIRKMMSWEERKKWEETTRKLVGFAKGVGLVPHWRHATDKSGWVNGVPTGDQWPRGLIGDIDANWEALIEHYGLDEDECDIEWARKVLARSIETARETCDYDDMLFQPVIAGVPFDRYDVVLVDEAQDVSGIQMEMIDRMSFKGPLSGRVIAVGDRSQCQPAGTMVRTPSGTVPIQSLKDGDSVVSVDFAHSCFKVGGDKVMVGSRFFSGKLVEVHSGGRSSRYTPNHICVANPKPLETMYAVYLMERQGQFRVGSTQMGILKGSGIRTRLLSEDADRLWVLDVHPTKAHACLQEAMIGHLYNLPERTFISQTADRSGKGLNQALLDNFWKQVDTQPQAMQLLMDYGRLYKYPLVSQETAHKFRTRRPSEIAACNLLAGMLVLHAEDVVHYKKHQWKPIDMVIRVPFEGLVYSLDVEDKHSYIADGIATHNSIYGFRGAGVKSMDEMKERFGMRELPLSVSYRCPRSVVEHARQWVPQIEWRENAPDGIVLSEDEQRDHHGQEDISKWTGLPDFRPGDAILCRLNRPLIEAAFALLRARIACRVLGRDIGAGLVALVKKPKFEGSRSVTDWQMWAAAHLERERGKLLAKREFAKLGQLEDRIATVEVFIDDLRAGSRVGQREPSIAELLSLIEEIFRDRPPEGMVTLATIHKAKGLEWERVFVLDAGKLMPVPWGRGGGWELKQEFNMCYVAATRAQRELRYITSEFLKEEQ